MAHLRLSRRIGQGIAKSPRSEGNLQAIARDRRFITALVDLRAERVDAHLVQDTGIDQVSARLVAPGVSGWLLWNTSLRPE